jgi:hypothetical protein
MAGSPRYPGDALGITHVHAARFYDYLLDGKDHFEPDRVAATEVLMRRPQAIASAHANRAFHDRVVRYLAEQGVRQFIDIGAGLPRSPDTHEIAQSVSPDAQVGYVDNDRLVLTHARGLHASHPDGRVSCIHADLRDTDLILREAARIIDFSLPVAILLLLVMHLIPDDDDDDPAGLVGKLAAPLGGGSYVAISHLSADRDPRQVGSAVRAFNEVSPVPVTARSYTEVRAMFGPLALVPPGLTWCEEWRPDCPGGSDDMSDIYGGIGAVSHRRSLAPGYIT